MVFDYARARQEKEVITPPDSDAEINDLMTEIACGRRVLFSLFSVFLSNNYNWKLSKGCCFFFSFFPAPRDRPCQK